MTIPPTKAEIDAAVAAPTVANALIDNLRRAGQDPSVIYPEMFGAVEVSRTDLPTFDPATTAAADTTALTAAFASLGTNGGTLLLRRPYGLTTGLTLTANRESVRDGQRIIGTGTPYSCGIWMTANNFNAITLRGTDISGGTKPIHPEFYNFGVYGGASTGHGIYGFNSDTANADVRISNAKFTRLRILCGGDAFNLGDSYNVLFDTCKVGSHKGHGFNIEGGNATSLINCHAEPVGRGKAGYRIVYFGWVRSSTGIDDSDEVCHWAMVGGRANITGTARTGGSNLIVRLAAADTGQTGEYDGLQLKMTSGAHDQFEGVVDKHVRGDATHGNYILLSTDTPLPSAVGADTYAIRDAESGRRGQGTATNRKFRGGFEGCNIEAFGRAGIKALWKTKMQINDCNFYDVADVGPGTNHDCSIYLFDDDTDAYGAWTSMKASKFNMGLTPRYGAEIIQAHGTRPIMRCEDQSTDYDQIRSLEAGATLQMGNKTAQWEILPTGFPTSNPGPGRLWLNGNVLTVGT